MYRHDTIQYNRFLSRDKTKADLIDYLTAKTPEYCTQTGHRLFFGHTSGNGVLPFQDNNHEEAHALLIYTTLPWHHSETHRMHKWFSSPQTQMSYSLCVSHSKLLPHAEEHVNFYGLWGWKDRSNMESHRGRKSKGFPSVPCVYWR